MKIFRHGDCDAQVEGVALCSAAVKDEVAGYCAFRYMDGGASGAAEGDGGGDVADGGARDVSSEGVEALAVDVDLATGHGGDGRDAVQMRGRGVGLVGREERAKGGHSEV
jgi:hypothetical protein